MGFGGEKYVFRLLFPLLKQKMRARGKKKAQGIEASEEQSGHAV